MRNDQKMTLKRVIGKIKDLPTLPRTVLKITSLVNDPGASAKDLSGVITDDQVLTARLLRLVNSSFYGFPQKIATVTNAIVLLGFDAIRNLLLTTSIFTLFSEKNNGDSHSLDKYWDHALGCAIGAKVIGTLLRYDKVEELFVAGLLHDIGKIVEIQFMPDEFKKIRNQVDENNLLMRDAEEAVLGFTHSEIGELLGETWNLPIKLVNIIAMHHMPEQSTGFAKEVSIIHLADILCRSLEMGTGGDNRIPKLNPNSWDLLNLKVEQIQTIMNEMEKEFGKLNPLFQ